MTLMDQNIRGPHAIFAKEFDPDTGNFSCSNRWGNGNLSEPTINKSRIYAVDYISIVQLNKQINIKADPVNCLFTKFR